MPGEWRVEDLRARISTLELELADAKRQGEEYANQFAEQQHRVRNALQALSLLLSAQARTAQQPELCMRCITRLASVCELNEALCGNENDISVAEFLPTLSHAIQQAFGDKICFDTQVSRRSARR